MNAESGMVWSRRIGGSAAVLVASGGVISLLGWLLNINRFSDWWATGITIKPNTCLALIICGGALFLTVYFPAARNTIRILSAAVLAIGAATLFEHIAHIDLGIDTLLFDEPPGMAATAAPGRMGPPASISFIALGAALILLQHQLRQQKIAVFLAMLVLGVGTLSLTGYLYGAESMYTIPRLTGIAVQTAILLILSSIGILATRPNLEPAKTLFEDNYAGILARRVMPVAIAVPLALGWLRVAGERAHLYVGTFGTALRTLAEMFLLGIILWRGVQAIRVREEQRRNAEKRHQLSDIRLTQTLESMTDGFVTLDAEGRFTYVNAQAEAIFDRDRSELIHRVVWDIFPHVIGTGLYNEILRAGREGITSEIDSDGIGKSSRRYFRNRIYPSADGGVSIYFQDVTLRREAEEAQRKADQQKDEFLATLAHELRNPLAPIGNAAALLATPGISKEMLQSSAAIIGRQVKHMARLLEDLLDISRVSRNRLELRKERVELKQVIEAAVETSRPVIEAAQHQLTITLPTEPIYIDGDLTRLAQIFSNLLNNSAKYTHPHGAIVVSADVEPSSVTVSISDNGVGIDTDVLPHIFDMFTQASPDEPIARSGLGIGLALARSIAQHHGGDIEARSAGKGMGSEFRVHLPRMAAGDENGKSPSLKNAVNSEGLRILVVDDHRDSADTLARLLQALGHETRATYTGEDTLQEVVAFQPDALFLDLGLPDLDGIEVCRRLRINESIRDLFIVAMTGWGQADDKQQTQQAGFDLHLVKPASADELMRLLNKISARKEISST